MVDMHQDKAKGRGIYLALGIDPEGDSCFGFYQNRIKMHSSIDSTNVLVANLKPL